MINKDSVIGLLLLMACGVFINALGDIEMTNYGTITSEVWPSIVLAVLTLFCAIYFIQSVYLGITTVSSELDKGTFSLKSFFPLNVCIVFGLFGVFVYTLPYLGMLIGGSLFVFLVLTLIGRKSLPYLFIHIGIALGSVAFMWIVFTYALNVMLPEGDLLYSILY